MSVTTAVVSFVASLFATDTEDNGPSGTEAVELALAEVNGLADQSFTATLGEPDVDSIGGEYLNTPQVIIPVYEVPIGNGGEMALDLDNFKSLLNALDVEINEVAGTEVPVEYIEGNVVVDWQQLFRTHEWGEEEIGEFVEEEETDDGTDSDDGGVTVETEEVAVAPSSEAQPAAGDD